MFVRAIATPSTAWRRPVSVVSATELYTEGGDAPGWPGAKSDHIGHR